MAVHRGRGDGREETCAWRAVSPSTAWRTGCSLEGPLTDIWIQPAAGDAGGSLGAALSAWHHRSDGRAKRNGDAAGGTLGPRSHDDEISVFIDPPSAYPLRAVTTMRTERARSPR